MGESGPRRGDDTAGGEVTLGGVGALCGEVILGGEYVRGDPIVAGDLRPLGVAKDGKISPERPAVCTRGVPTTCSGSTLRLRGTADRRNIGGTLTGRCLLKPKPTPVGAGAGTDVGAGIGVVSVPTSREVRGEGRSLGERISHCTLCSVVSGLAWTPRERYFFFVLN
jgi:hypothetical protein